MPKGGQPGRINNSGGAVPYAACAMLKPQQFASLKPQLYERDIAASLRNEGYLAAFGWNNWGGNYGIVTDRYLRLFNLLWAFYKGDSGSYFVQSNLSNESTFTYGTANGYWREIEVDCSEPLPNPYYGSWTKVSGVCTTIRQGTYPLYALVRMDGQSSYNMSPESLARRSASFAVTRMQNSFVLTVIVNNPYLGSEAAGGNTACVNTWNVTIDLAALDAMPFHPRIDAQFSSGIEAAPRDPVTLQTTWAGTFEAYHNNESSSPMLWTFGIWPF